MAVAGTTARGVEYGDRITFSDSGNLVISSDDENEIDDAFKRLVAEAPNGERNRFQLVVFDDAGEVVVRGAPGKRFPPPA